MNSNRFTPVFRRSLYGSIAIALHGILLGSMVGCASPHDHRFNAVLAMSWQEFDQTANSGWRAFADREEYRLAADLIEAYLREHSELTVRQRAVSHFHAGYLRARVGDIQAGVVHMQQAIVPNETPEGLGDDWNIIVLSHIAFVMGDRAKLIALEEDITRLPRSRVEFPACPGDLLEHFGQPLGTWKSK